MGGSGRFAAIITFCIVFFFQAIFVELGLKDEIDVTFPELTTQKKTENRTYDIEYLTKYTTTVPTTVFDGDIAFSDGATAISFGGAGNDVIKASCATADGGFVICGNMSSPVNSLKITPASGWTYPFAFVVKFDSSGSVQWAKGIGGNGMTSFEDVAQLSDGCIVAVGYTQATNLIDSSAELGEVSVIDAIAFKFTSSGSVARTLVLQGKGYDYFDCIVALPDGGFVTGGNSTSYDGNYSFLPQTPSATLMAYASDFRALWNDYMTGTTGARFTDLCIDSSGNLFAVCLTNSSDLSFADYPQLGRGSNDVLVCKYSTDGEFVWGCPVSSSGDDRFENVAPNGTGGCYVAGYYKTKNDSGVTDGTLSECTNHGGVDAAVIEIDSNGNPDDIYSYSGFYDDYITDIVPVDGGLVLSGYTESGNRTFLPIGNLGDRDAFLLQVKNDGSVLNLQSASGSGQDCAYSVCVSDQLGVILSGTTCSTDEFFADSTEPPVEYSYTAFAAKYELK
ncbi:MAG: hypothetical protein IJC37_03470 [Clostridia bacterium]|nr:hypothetical protein [Clostridia bacterium]